MPITILSICLSFTGANFLISLIMGIRMERLAKVVEQSKSYTNQDKIDRVAYLGKQSATNFAEGVALCFFTYIASDTELLPLFGVWAGSYLAKSAIAISGLSRVW